MPGRIGGFVLVGSLALVLAASGRSPLARAQTADQATITRGAQKPPEGWLVAEGAIPPELERESVAAVIKVHGPGYLVRMLRVQEELALTKAQIQAIEDIERRAERERKPWGLKLGQWQKTGMARVDKNEIKAAKRALQEIRQATDRAIEETLDPGQRERLSQIIMQAKGPIVPFVDPTSGAGLALSDGQRREIEAALRVREAKEEALANDRTAAFEAGEREQRGKAVSQGAFHIWDAFHVSKGSWAKLNALDIRANELDEETARIILGLLTEPQKNTYHSLYGKPFNFVALKARPSREREPHGGILVFMGVNILAVIAAAVYYIRSRRSSRAKGHETAH